MKQLKFRFSKGQVMPEEIDLNSSKKRAVLLQVNLCQKLSFLNQLTDNMTTDCSLNYKKNTTSEYVLDVKTKTKTFLYTTCSELVI